MELYQVKSGIYYFPRVSRYAFPLLLLVLHCVFTVSGKDLGTIPNQETINIPFTSRNIIIDGKLEDWKTFFPFKFRDTNRVFRSISGYSLKKMYPGLDSSDIRLPLSRNEADVFLCWDKQNLYIAVVVKDGHLFNQWESASEYPFIYLNDAVEVYIDSRNDSRKKMDINDYQFIVDIRNQQACFRGTLSMIKKDTFAVPKENGQNLLFHSAVDVQGRIDGQYNPGNQYTVEIRIPFATIGLEPETGDTMRMDLGVEDADYFINDLEHPKETSYNWAFNWVGLNDFGYPKSWKTVVLTGHPSLYARISEQYQRYWIPVLIATILLSGVIIIFLYRYSRKLKKLPSYEDWKKKKVVIVQAGATVSGEQEGHNQKILRDAADFVIQNIQESVHSEDVAKHLSISLRTFQRITREELNCTPTSFITLVKLNLAAEFLKRKQGNISEAAYHFGFSDPGYFSRQFRQHFRVSPTEYITTAGKRPDE